MSSKKRHSKQQKSSASRQGDGLRQQLQGHQSSAFSSSAVDAQQQQQLQQQQQPKGTAQEESEGTSDHEAPKAHGSSSSSSKAKSSSRSRFNPAPRGSVSGGSVAEHLSNVLISGAAARTRSQAQPSLDLDPNDWEAVFIEKGKKATAERDQTHRLQSEQLQSQTRPTTGQPSPSPPLKERGKVKKTRVSAIQRAAELANSPHAMSRNRSRAAPAADNAEELNLWQKIVQDIHKAKDLNDKQNEILDNKINVLNHKIGREKRNATLAELEQLDEWHRQVLKLSEQEGALLKNDPGNIKERLQLLAALRSHSENNGPSGKQRKRKGDTADGPADSPAPSTAAGSEKLGRLKSATNRSASASATRGREGEAAEGTKGTAAEKEGQLFVGAEVVFKHNKKQHGMEGEGIQCIIKTIAGEGSKRRYEIQDPEPIENGEEGAVYKTTAASLIPIPKAGTSLLSFPAGKQVLARYPDTTTFYRAEVVGSKRDTCRLRFEGEEDDKELEVDRRFVLDIAGK